jgi:hypothetical protein
MEPLVELSNVIALRDKLSVWTPAPDRLLSAGSIGTVVAAHTDYGYYLVVFDPRGLWCSWRGQTWRHCPRTLLGRPLAGRPAGDDFGYRVSRPPR